MLHDQADGPFFVLLPLGTTPLRIRLILPAQSALAEIDHGDSEFHCLVVIAAPADNEVGRPHVLVEHVTVAQRMDDPDTLVDDALACFWWYVGDEIREAEAGNVLQQDSVYLEVLSLVLVGGDAARRDVQL